MRKAAIMSIQAIEFTKPQYARLGGAQNFVVKPEASRAPKDPALLNALTIIAHDLRGPLANLSLLIELIETHAQMQSLAAVAQSSLKAQEMIQALDGLLNGFLQRARDTGDPLSFKPSLVNLADVVSNAVELNRPVAESRGVTFECANVVPYVIKGDAGLLGEAIENLIGNAVKHTREGSHVTCEVTAAGREAIVRISDDGDGLSSADLKRAFRPFATLSPKYDGKSTSWGLGLWIVRLIAERHGGRVEVATGGIRRGTRFSLHLPAGRL